MKIRLIVLICVVLCVACEKHKKKENPHHVIVSDEEPAPTFERHSDRLRNFVAKENTTFRGVEIGYTMPEVRGVEKAQHRESGDDYIQYEISSTPEYSAEVEYRFDKGLLKEIEALAFFDDEVLRNDFYNELVSYYDSVTDIIKVEKGGTTSFEVGDAYVLIEKAGTSNHPDLRVLISPKA